MLRGLPWKGVFGLERLAQGDVALKCCKRCKESCLGQACERPAKGGVSLALGRLAEREAAERCARQDPGQCEGQSDNASSTPPAVPGAAPALAKAGVGGYIHMYDN